MKNFIDEETGLFALDEMILEMPSYQRILEDKQTTDEEFVDQAELVVSLVKEVEETLGEHERDLVWRMVGELAVLFELHTLQKEE
jgi:hypothetical protein